MPQRLLVVDDAFPAGARDVHVTPKITVDKAPSGSFDVTLKRPDGSEVAAKASINVAHIRGPQAPFGMYRLLGVKVEDVPVGTEIWSPGSVTLTSTVPARLDHLPWGRWHWRVVTALGVTWILDGLEVTIVGALGPVLERSDTLALTTADVGYAASAYVGGAILGALVFGHLSDHLGRKKLFLVTLILYLVATVLTGASWSFASFALFRFATGLAIGGEYAAINSAIDELLPARVRGFADLAINGTYWVGAALGAGASLLLLDPARLPRNVGWRIAFGMGALLGFAAVLVRRHVPESPRWLLLHGRADEAERIMSTIEDDLRAEGREIPAKPAPAPLASAGAASLGAVARVVFGPYRRRAILGFSLMVAQAFFYNAIFFTYGLVLTHFYGVQPEAVGTYLVPFAVGNFLGPLLLGPLFDRIGRKVMIVVTYGLSGFLLLVTGWLFLHGLLDATTQTFAWSVVFFVASAAASSAYLTVSELFPVELRAMAIALFYAIGTGAGGLVAPALFSRLIATGKPEEVFFGYGIGAALMMGAALVAAVLGVSAERRSLEELRLP